RGGHRNDAPYPTCSPHASPRRAIVRGARVGRLRSIKTGRSGVRKVHKVGNTALWIHEVRLTDGLDGRPHVRAEGARSTLNRWREVPESGGELLVQGPARCDRGTSKFWSTTPPSRSLEANAS